MFSIELLKSKLTHEAVVGLAETAGAVRVTEV